MKRSARRLLVTLAVFAVFPLLVNGCSSCKKPPPPAEDAAPPAETDAASIDLAPLEEDAGEDADAAEAGKKWTGGPGDTGAAARIKACCGAMAAQAAHMQQGPERFQLEKVAVPNCYGLAAQANQNPGAFAAAVAIAQQYHVACQ